MTPPAVTCHGVLLEVAGSGLLITGAAGVGKSTLALELLRRGHKLVADDQVELWRCGGRLLGRRPPGLPALLHVRALGMIAVRETFGPEAVVTTDVAVELTLLLGPLPGETPASRLHGHRDHWRLGECELPRLWLDPAAGSALATLAELAARQRRATALEATSHPSHSRSGG
jgi:HPr kinase/phosphorylase